MNTIYALLGSILLLAANGFFVAAEFSLVASKSHRLEETASSGGRAARAAAQASRQLGITLAGAQLGITLCSLGLGALAEPAMANVLSTLFHHAGIQQSISHAIALIVALIIVVFSHMVIGEMAPKSWAITHPERSALYLALPFSAFNIVAKPLLRLLNLVTNAILGIFKIHPQDELAQAHGPEELQMLLEASREHGTLPHAEHTLLSRMLRLQRTTVARVMVPRANVVSISIDASAIEIERTSKKVGKSRLAITTGDGAIVGLVHVRDAVKASTLGHSASARELMGDALSIDHNESVASAVQIMREHRSQLAVVTANNQQTGLVALEDLLEQILGQFDDETD